jgi:hypothetical protein
MLVGCLLPGLTSPVSAQQPARAIQQASAQQQAKIDTTLNVVKVKSQNATNFTDGRPKMPLFTGDNLRTGARSAAQLTFTSDNSILRVGELSDIVVRTSYRQKEVNVTAGRVYGDYKGPGRFRGRYAVAAVRGTQVEMTVEDGKTVVRCWSGSVLVGGPDAQIVTDVGNSTAGQLQSNSLIGSQEKWVGAHVDITSGPNKGQQRTITNFDPATGTISWNQPLPGGVAANVAFTLATGAPSQYVLLTPGEETFVLNLRGSIPVAPRPTPPLKFAGGSAHPWMNQGFSGAQENLLAGSQQEQTRAQTYVLDQQRDASQPWGGAAPGVQLLTGSLNIDLGSVTNLGAPGGISVSIGGGSSSNKTAVKSSSSPTRLVYPPQAQVGGVGYATTGAAASLAYAQASSVVGQTLVQVGGYMGSLPDSGRSQLDQLSLTYRDNHAGDFEVGRFHWFPEPINNTTIGRLISFTTTDGILWRPPTGEATQVDLGYFTDINPLFGPSVGGYAARVSFPARKGRFGLTALGVSHSGGGLGEAADLIYPIIEHKLQFYGDGGQDPFHNDFYAFGIYLPSLFQRYHIDLALEYAYRDNFGSSVDLNVYVPFARYFIALVTLSKPGSRSWEPGIGLLTHF